METFSVQHRYVRDFIQLGGPRWTNLHDHTYIGLCIYIIWSRLRWATDVQTVFRAFYPPFPSLVLQFIVRHVCLVRKYIFASISVSKLLSAVSTDIRHPEELSLLRPVEEKKKKKDKDSPEEIYNLVDVPLSLGTCMILYSCSRPLMT